MLTLQRRFLSAERLHLQRMTIGRKGSLCHPALLPLERQFTFALVLPGPFATGLPARKRIVLLEDPRGLIRRPGAYGRVLVRRARRRVGRLRLGLRRRLRDR